MNTVTIRFYAQLNDFLPAAKRQTAFTCTFDGRRSVKDLIESLGIPHPEIALVIINGESTAFSTHLNGGETISVYPDFRSISIDDLTRVRPHPLTTIKFALDCHLGKLASYLRMMGFDSFYRTEIDDSSLAGLAAAEHRIILTCDQGLLKRNNVFHGYCIRGKNPRQQLIEVFEHFELASQINPFQRCINCNALLIPVDKSEIIDYLPPHIKDYGQNFRLCSGCGKIYWSGTHYDNMTNFIDKILAEVPESQ